MSGDMERQPLTPQNTRCDGRYKWPEWRWAGMNWTDAFVDPGPSPAGNPGPYLKVPFPKEGTRHRIYPWPPRLVGVAQFERTGEGETGWVLVVPKPKRRRILPREGADG